LGKLQNLIGQKRLKNMIQRDITACRIAKEIFPHSMLLGPGGLGKTSFTEAIAHDLDYHFVMIEGAMVKTRKQMLHRLADASAKAEAYERPLLFFIDEVHRLAADPQESLYYPMTQWKITELDADIPPFALFAATTHPHMLLRPFLSRIRNKWHLDRYSEDDIQLILLNEFDKYKLIIDAANLDKIAKRCLGIPRLATDLTLKVRNEVLCRGGELQVTAQDCDRTFSLESIDPIGLNAVQVKYLIVLYEAQGTPKGVGGLAGVLDRDVEVVCDSIEPVLLSLSFIDRTRSGRVLTAKGRKHLIKTGKIMEAA